MDLGRAQYFLNEKTILVTGATGFLAKVFVEKVLRIQPKISKLYLPLRASDTELATQRLQNEVIQTDLFKVLRDEWGEEFDSFISEKIVVIEGDVSRENLGLKDANLLNEMLERIDIIVNFAACTKFDERFDIAMGVNTMGALQVLNFARICHRMQLLLHVSTAYVCGEADDEEVIIQEKPFEMGQTLKGTSKLDIHAEKDLAETKIAQLRAEEACEKTIAFAMKDYGIKRTIDSIIGAYGKGKMNCFLGHPNTILDAIPADMVINCLITTIVTYSNQNDPENFIYHVASSSRNPLRISNVHDISYRYFTRSPCTNKSGKPVIVSKVKFLTSMAAFNRYMKIRCELPLKGLYLVNKVFCQCFEDNYTHNRKKVRTVMRMVELYKPYVLLKAIFDDTNTETLRRATKDYKMQGIGLDFDPKIIDWTEYMMNAHIPGLLKYAVK